MWTSPRVWPEETAPIPEISIDACLRVRCKRLTVLSEMNDSSEPGSIKAVTLHGELVLRSTNNWAVARRTVWGSHWESAQSDEALESELCTGRCEIGPVNEAFGSRVYLEEVEGVVSDWLVVAEAAGVETCWVDVEARWDEEGGVSWWWRREWWRPWKCRQVVLFLHIRRLCLPRQLKHNHLSETT